MPGRGGIREAALRGLILTTRKMGERRYLRFYALLDPFRSAGPLSLSLSSLSVASPLPRFAFERHYSNLPRPFPS